MLKNELDLGVTNPRVLVFPLNGVGRPLGMASSDASVTLTPSQSLRFETKTVADPGAHHAAFATASVIY
jgi:hypothetical protein